MIYITQGHEKSISIEVLLKALLMIPKDQQKNFVIVADQNILLTNMNDLGIQFSLEKNMLRIGHVKVEIKPIQSKDINSSLNSIEECLSNISKKDILITMPTTKDVFKKSKINFAGHTEYFRNRFNRNLTMNFINDKEQVLILTDHLPLSEVSESLTKESIIEQINTSLKGIENYFSRTIKRVVITGINPHAGENGLIGEGDYIIKEVISELKEKHNNIKFIGPIPGDTMHLNDAGNTQTLQVFCHHDQALSYFKFKTGFIAINTTFGLDFLRLSVDHGTACSLYAKNIANPMGAYFVLKEALNIHEKIRS